MYFATEPMGSWVNSVGSKYLLNDWKGSERKSLMKKLMDRWVGG